MRVNWLKIYFKLKAKVSVDKLPLVIISLRWRLEHEHCIPCHINSPEMKKNT